MGDYGILVSSAFAMLNLLIILLVVAGITATIIGLRAKR